MDFQELINNPWFWGAVFFAAWSGLYVVVKALFRGVPLVGRLLNRGTLMLVGAIGVVVTAGLLGGFGTGSLDRVSGMPGGFKVSDLQVTTAFTSDAGPAPAENANIDDLIDWYAYDTNVTETAASEEIYTGVITVTRAGELDPYSCKVSAILPQSYADEAGDDGRRYNIIEKTTTGYYEVYLADGAAATINSPKQSTMLSFSDGEAATTLGVVMEVDEEGHDALNANSHKDVILNVCGKPFTFRIHRED